MYLMAAVPSYCKNAGQGGSGCRESRGTDCVASSGAACLAAADSLGLLEIDENDNSFPWGLIHHSELAHMLNTGLGKTMVIDSRSFLEYNTSNIQQAVNVCCSKLVKRRLQQDKVHVLDLLNQTVNIGADASWDVIVYDQCTEDPSQLTSDNFVAVLLHKLSTTFNSVAFLKGGFLAFQASHPSLTENKSSSHRCSTLTSLSQPCMPVSNVGPTRILPFLYLGSQQDSLNQELAQVNGISYVLNVSKTCPRPPFILDGHFHRIPVNDNYCEKLLPYFTEAFQFLDKVREANGCVLVHCLGGVSRSATLAIAYIMRYFRMSSDEAYRYVKDKRPTISPNFNFLGQLLEYEKILRHEEQEEDARKKIMRFEEGFSGDIDRVIPGVMDLHSTSPSSPSPRRTQHRPFHLYRPVFEPYATCMTSSLRTAVLGQPLEAASSVAALEDSHNQRDSDLFHLQEPSADLCPLPRSSLESCPFPGPPSELCSLPRHMLESCPFPGPSLELRPTPRPSLESCPFPGPSSVQDPFDSHSACFSAVYRNHKTDAAVMPASCVSHELDQCHQDMATSFCDNPKQDIHPVIAQSPVCPVTGFPSPASATGDFPKSTCPRTGFPGPGHYGSNLTATQLTQHPTSNISHVGHETATGKTDTETVFKTCVTYHHAADSSSSSSLSTELTAPSQSDTSNSDQDPLPKSSQQEHPRARSGFSLSSMLSSLRWKSRPPTLSLGSPVGSVKESNRHLKKHLVETVGAGDTRVQLTPVSEAVENCDLVISEGVSVAAAGVPAAGLTQSELDVVTHTSQLGNCSSLPNATNIAMASTPNHVCLASALSLTSSHTHNSVPVTATSSYSQCTHVMSTSCTSSSMVKPTRLSISAKRFTLPLSSPVSDFPATATAMSRSGVFSLPSPSDSNKRKSCPALSSDSPDKQAKTEEGSHLHTLSPPRALNLSLGLSTKQRPRLSCKRPFVLPISSPTTDMARLKVTSPSDPPAEAAKQDELTALEVVSACHGDTDLNTDHDPGRAGQELASRMMFTSSDAACVCDDVRMAQPCGYTRWKSARSLSISTSCLIRTSLLADTVAVNKVATSRQQQQQWQVDTSLVKSSSSSLSAMSLSSSSLLSKSCTSIYSASSTRSSHGCTNSSSISSSASCCVNLQGFSQFPTTSLDQLSFTPCYTKDIVQDLKGQESEQLTPAGHGSSPTEANLGPSVLDSPMSISSGGSSAPSLASSTLSPVESNLASVFSDSTFPMDAIHHRRQPFQFVPSQMSLHESSVMASFGSSQDSPKSGISPTSSPSDTFVLSPLSMPQATTAPTTPAATYCSYSYCSSIAAEPLSPMSLSDSASTSSLRSPTRNDMGSSLSTPGSSLSSPEVSSPPFSPLVSSPVSSSSSVTAAAASSTTSHSKVILRRDKGKRLVDRPNSIAFSSYPTCDLVPAASGSHQGQGCTSQDDSSEAYMSGKSKRSRRSNHSGSHQPLGRTSWGGHSEREMYKQITAAMENAMLRTQVFSSTSPGGRRVAIGSSCASSRKARSLDDIVDGSVDEDDLITSQQGSVLAWGRCTEHSLFEKYRCGLQNVSEPYHSSSSLSSNGSHSGSMEIQPLNAMPPRSSSWTLNDQPGISSPSTSNYVMYPP